MHAGGLGRYVQFGRDLAVAAPSREQPQYLQLASGQAERYRRGGLAVAGDLDARPPRQPGYLLQQRAGEELAGEFPGPLQPGGRGVAVSRRRCGVRAAQQRICQRVRLSEGLPGGGVVPGGLVRVTGGAGGFGCEHCRVGLFDPAIACEACCCLFQRRP